MIAQVPPTGTARPRRDALKRGLDRVLEQALFVLLSAMSLAVLWQVFSRFVLRDPSSVTEELARFLMIWVGLLGATYAVGQRLHPAVGIAHLALARRLPLRGLTKALPRLLVAAFAALVLVGGGSELVRLTFQLEQTSAAMGLPLGWVYAALPISGAFLILYSWCLPPDGGR
jgi:TRAP-type C4-dicarboxylate transport system permease small subunit